MLILSPPFSFGIALISESPVTVQVSLLQQLQQLLPPPHKPPRPHRIRMQLLRVLQLVQQRRQPCRHHHLLLLLQAALLTTMHVDLITLARMVCAAVSGDIAVPLKIIAANAARVTVVDNLHHHLALLHLAHHHPVQLLPQTILRHLLDSTTVPIMEKIQGSLHTLGIGKLVLPMSKSMLTLTS